MNNFLGIDLTGWTIIFSLLAGGWFMVDKVLDKVGYPMIDYLADIVKARLSQAGGRALSLSDDQIIAPNSSETNLLPSLLQASRELAEYKQQITQINRQGGNCKYRPPAHAWLPVLVNDFSHIMVVTETGGGKTTLLRALRYICSQQGEILWLSPKAQYNKDPYAIGHGLNYKVIAAAFMRLEKLKSDRYQEFAHGKEDFVHLYVFIDEWPAIYLNLREQASEFMKSMSNEARQAHIHLIIATQSELVEDLGLKGSSAIRENFTQIYVGKKAREVMNAFRPGEYSSADKHALVLGAGSSLTSLGSEEIPYYAQQQLVSGCGWSLYSTLPDTTTTVTSNPNPVAVNTNPNLWAGRVMLNPTPAEMALKNNPNPSQPLTPNPNPVRIEGAPFRPEGEEAYDDIADTEEALGIAGFTAEHLKIAQWLKEDAKLSGRTIALRLWNTSSGRKIQKACKMLDVVKEALQTENSVPESVPEDCSSPSNNLLEFKKS